MTAAHRENRKNTKQHRESLARMPESRLRQMVAADYSQKKMARELGVGLGSLRLELVRLGLKREPRARIRSGTRYSGTCPLVSNFDASGPKRQPGLGCLSCQYGPLCKRGRRELARVGAL